MFWKVIVKSLGWKSPAKNLNSTDGYLSGPYDCSLLFQSLYVMATCPQQQQPLVKHLPTTKVTSQQWRVNQRLTNGEYKTHFLMQMVAKLDLYSTSLVSVLLIIIIILIVLFFYLFICYNKHVLTPKFFMHARCPWGGCCDAVKRFKFLIIGWCTRFLFSVNRVETSSIYFWKEMLVKSIMRLVFKIVEQWK